MDKPYIKDIPDALWIREKISEVFDNALELLPKSGSVVLYGGAVRDCLAGKELIGDLDVIVDNAIFGRAVNNFYTNVKWTANKPGNNYTIAYNSCSVATVLNTKISKVESFRTISGKKVQLILPKVEKGVSPVDTALQIIRMSDIVCCGVAMFDDKVVEVISDAYKDCVDGVLHLNTKSHTIRKEVLQARVRKLEARGWSNKIDIGGVDTTSVCTEESTKPLKAVDANKMYFTFGSATKETKLKRYIISNVPKSVDIMSLITTISKTVMEYEACGSIAVWLDKPDYITEIIVFAETRTKLLLSVQAVVNILHSDQTKTTVVDWAVAANDILETIYNIKR